MALVRPQCANVPTLHTESCAPQPSPDGLGLSPTADSRSEAKERLHGQWAVGSGQRAVSKTACALTISKRPSRSQCKCVGQTR